MPIGLPCASTMAQASPGAKASSGERATSISLENTHKWPARRRASSPRLRNRAGQAGSEVTAGVLRAGPGTVTEPSPGHKRPGPALGWGHALHADDHDEPSRQRLEPLSAP